MIRVRVWYQLAHMTMYAKLLGVGPGFLFPGVLMRAATVRPMRVSPAIYIDCLLDIYANEHTTSTPTSMMRPV